MSMTKLVSIGTYTFRYVLKRITNMGIEHKPTTLTYDLNSLMMRWWSYILAWFQIEINFLVSLMDSNALVQVIYIHSSTFTYINSSHPKLSSFFISLFLVHNNFSLSSQLKETTKIKSSLQKINIVKKSHRDCCYLHGNNVKKTFLAFFFSLKKAYILCKL